MTEHLVFTLAGPFASFGDVAGNERRGTRHRPGHSMLAGLLAAALGIRRNEHDRLQSLSEACRFAVRTDRQGNLLTDYHTVQSAKRKRNFAPLTRKQMLEKGERTTIITRREYLIDVRFTVACIVDGSAAEYTTPALTNALGKPTFAPYLGRRACSPSLPLTPDLIMAPNATEAFETYDARHAQRLAALWPDVRPPWRHSTRTAEIAADTRLYPDQMPDGRIERRRARPSNRGTWRFDTLDELVLSPMPSRDKKEDGA